MPRVTQQALRDADLTFTWKLCLRSFSIILAAIAIGLIAWVEIHRVKPVFDADNSINYDAYGGGYDDDWGDSNDFLLPWVHISLGLSIVWNFANIGVWFTPSRSGRGMHPGANVGCDLILWLLLLLTGIFASVSADFYIAQYGGYSNDYYDGYTLSNGTHVSYAANGTEILDPNDCAPFLNCSAQSDYHQALNHRGVVVAVGVALSFLVMLFHFALFISACRYTHERRNQKGGKYAKALTTEATAIATQMVRDMGFQPPPQWPMQPLQQGPPPMAQSYYAQPKYEPTSDERAIQSRYQQQIPEIQQQQAPEIQHQQDAGFQSGKGKQRDLEHGPEISPISNGEGSSRQHPPGIAAEDGL